MPEEVISTIKPPVAEQIDTAMTIHGDTRIDKYYWMNDRNDPRVISYLKAENAYLDTIMKPSAKLRQKLYDEMRGHIMETDASVPYLKEGYYYYTRYTQGKEYPVYCRKKGSLEATEEIILDVNVLAVGHDYYQVGGLTVSPDGLWLAYGVDTVSRRKYTIYIKNLQTGELLPETIAETSGSVAWASDNKTFFYTVKNPVTLREERIKRHVAGTDAAKDKDIFTEKDEAYTTRTYRSKSGKFIMIESSSTLSSEFRILDASKPDGAFRIFQPREKDMLYDIDHQDNQFYIVTNWEAVNFRLMQCPQDKTERSNWKEVIPHRADVLLQGIELFREHLVLSERKNGLTQLRVINTFIQHGGQHIYKGYCCYYAFP